MDFNFDSLQKGIATRDSEIKALRAQISGLLIVGPELQAVVDPSAEKDAREIMAQINDLKQRNVDHIVYLDYARQLLREHNLPTAGIVNFGEYISNLRNQIHHQIQALGKRFISGEFTSAEYDAQAAAIKEPLEARIAEIEAIESKLSNYWAGHPVQK
ncbi:MAG TPA: hypothetical protein HA257_09335 [Candidatus Methanoperedenaceae archaeon]|nr:hypothetical protein [Candidatus Methanoperedenaceae archaeon]